MKSLFCVIALCIASPFAAADDASVKMVLDSVHGKGFKACDNKIQEEFADETISHVETKIPFFDSSKKAALTDEIIIITSSPGNSQYDYESRVQSLVIRKVGKQCLVAHNLAVGSSINRGCEQVAKSQHNGNVVARTDNETWTAEYADDGAQMIYSPLPNGACRYIQLPWHSL